TPAEHKRLQEINGDADSWRAWGGYVSDRAWGTVREDYTADGNAWDFLSHDMARSKAYRWGEDAIGGLCDRYQLLLFAPAFWNRRDPILKERLFGLTSSEGNHGEDAKEYYFYLDNTPTHSYMKLLYKYPQQEFPYAQLLDENRRRGGAGFEYELLDTGVFDQDRYFDISIEYAKLDPQDICIRIEAINRGPDAAPFDVLPHLWFRNLWSWTSERGREPIIQPGPTGKGFISVVADDAQLAAPMSIPQAYRLGVRTLYGPAGGQLLFTDNETNAPRVFGPGSSNGRQFVKDAFHRHVIQGEHCLNPGQFGTKSALHYRFDAVPPGGSAVLCLRLTDKPKLKDPLGEIQATVTKRRAEADEFYASLHPAGASEDERQIQRQALAGMLWTKQSYLFDVNQWLEGDNPSWPPPDSRKGIRNQHWKHLNTLRVMTVPDKWEY
ncbi:MAG: glucosidase, partial [Pirellulales bacterium]